MPEMTDAMYCHQQICIPPTFPYLLRQYAKAAIRSQPNDLLRWSTAYFRALALGIPPPAKLRLEYPIPQTHYGLTPGWLKTLLHQLKGHHNVTWPQLYDRWRGACLQVDGLKEIILLAGFPDPVHIPWFRFVAVAAGHLTQNLTNSMILICELLTEEPEGASSAIPYTTFADLYRFLAKLDACEPRTAQNFYFTESNLNLTKQELLSEMGSDKKFEDLDRSLVTTDKYMEEASGEDMSLHYSDLHKYLETIEATNEEENETSVRKTPHPKSETNLDTKDPAPLESNSSCYIILDPEDGKLCKEKHDKEESSEESTVSSEHIHVEQIASKETLEAEEHTELYPFADDVSKESQEMSSVTSTTEEVSPGYVEVEIPAVAGIGPAVPDDVIDVVMKYLRGCANKQQGMVMPRNIKHFLCPPLEVCVD